MLNASNYLLTESGYRAAVVLHHQITTIGFETKYRKLIINLLNK